jgi:predicted pPIWI-associating nuclease
MKKKPPHGVTDVIADMVRRDQEMRDLLDPPSQRLFRDLVKPPPAFDVGRSVLSIGKAAMLASPSKHIQDLLDPPFAKLLREITERDGLSQWNRGIGTDLSSIAHAVSQLAKPSNRIEALLGSSALQKLSGVEQGLSDYATQLSALGRLTTFTEEVESALRFGTTSGMIMEETFRRAHLDRQAQYIQMACDGIPKLALEGPAISVGRILTSGASFIESEFVDAPSEIVAEVAPEVFRALDLDRAIADGSRSSVDTQRDGLASGVEDELQGLLADLEPELVTMLLGARAAEQSGQPDRARHVCTSLRELFGHVLRTLAPDEAIKAWSADASHYHEGRPTRNARMVFIYRSVSSSPLRKFIDADIRAAIELVDVLNNGTHVARFAVDEKSLRILRCRLEGVLLMILKVAEASN